MEKILWKKYAENMHQIFEPCPFLILVNISKQPIHARNVIYMYIYNYINYIYTYIYVYIWQISNIIINIIISSLKMLRLFKKKIPVLAKLVMA